MSSCINKVILIGNVGKDPFIHFFPDGTKIVSFPLATSDSWKDKKTGEQKEKTEWHSIVISNELFSEVAEKYIKSGTKIYIEGQIQKRKWINKEGKEIEAMEIILPKFRGNLILLSPKN